MEKIFLKISQYFHMNENASKIIIILFVFLLIIGLIWGRMLYNKDNPVKKLIGKFYYKYITLCMLICVMISAIITGIIQFVYKDILGYAVLITLCLGIISFVWAFIHDRISLFRYYPSDERLQYFFEYFKNNVSDLKYTEIITWISRWIHHYFRFDNKQNEKIKKLELLLRPENNGLCLAIYHKNEFIYLCKKICECNDDNYIIKSITETYDIMRSKEKEKYRPIHNFLRIMLLDKNILWYILIIILHFIGCILISETPRLIIGNLLLYLPGDALLLLIYFGIVKQQKEKEFKAER